MSNDAWVMGTYALGLFHNTELRRAILRQTALRKGVSIQFAEDSFSQSREYYRLADLVRSSLDMTALYQMVGLACR